MWVLNVVLAGDVVGDAVSFGDVHEGEAGGIKAGGELIGGAGDARQHQERLVTARAGDHRR